MKFLARWAPKTFSKKLTWIVSGTLVCAMVASAITMIGLLQANTKADLRRELGSVARILGANVAASLTFNTPQDGVDTLSSIRSHSNLQAARVFRKDHSVFATFTSKKVYLPTEVILGSGEDQAGVWVTEAVKLDGATIGYVWVSSDLSGLKESTSQQMRFMLATILFIGGLGGVIVNRLQRGVLRPVRELALAMNQIRQSRDYLIRVDRPSDTEIADLTDAFNGLLDEISRSEREVIRAQSNLEERVHLRTVELQLMVSERQRAEAALAEANAGLEIAATEAKRLATEAKAASKAKSQFVANMSHEIRTPMNGVIGMTELLLGTSLNAEQKDYAEVVAGSARDLMVIIDDVLDFSKIEAGFLELEMEPFDLRSALEDSVALHAPRAHSRGLEIALDFPPDREIIVTGDALRLRQVVGNLVSNAIKFTLEGSVLVKARVEDDALTIDVVDTGIGIPANRQAAIFQSFTQGDGSTTRRFGGTGLGLSICQQLVSLMGGQISVVSSQNVGSTFSVKAPLQFETRALLAPEGIVKRVAVDAETTHTSRLLLRQLLALGCTVDPHVTDETELVFLEHPHRAQGSARVVNFAAIPDPGRPGDLGPELLRVALSGPIRLSQLLATLSRKPASLDGFQPSLIETPASGVRVLCAEDSPVNRRVVARLLEREGAEVVTVENGAEVLERLRTNEPFDVILMDCQMPVLDGFLTTEAIRDERASWSTIPIIALTANALVGDRERCLTSGMNDYLPKPIVARDLLAAILRWSNQATHIEIAHKEAQSSQMIFRHGYLLDDCGLERETAREIVQDYAAALPKVLAQLELALELEQFETIRKHAHSLKGSSGSVGADVVRQIAQSIEEHAINKDILRLTNDLANAKVSMDQFVAAFVGWSEPESMAA